jgi:hypothetical protein
MRLLRSLCSLAMTFFRQPLSLMRRERRPPDLVLVGDATLRGLSRGTSPPQPRPQVLPKSSQAMSSKLLSKK